MRLLVLDENLAAALFDRPASHRGQSRRGDRFARLEVKVRVVPWAADRFAREQPVGEGAVIMRAVGRKREKLAALTHEQDLVVTDVACQHGSFSEVGSRDAG